MSDYWLNALLHRRTYKFTPVVTDGTAALGTGVSQLLATGIYPVRTDATGTGLPLLLADGPPAVSTRF